MFGPPHLEVRRPSPTTVEFIVTTKPRRTGWTGRALVVASVAVRVLLAVFASSVLWMWFKRNWGALQPWNHHQQQPTQPVSHEQPWRWSTEYAEYSKQYSRAYSNSGRREDLWQALALDALDLLVASAQQVVPAAAAAVAYAATAAPPWIVLPVCCGALWASVARVHTSESLLVLRGLGIQTRSTGATYLGELVSGLSVVWWVLATPIALLARFFSISSSRDDPSSSSSSLAHSLVNYDGYYGEPAPAATRFIPTERLQDLLVNEAFRGFEVRYYLVAVVVAGRRAGVALGGPGGGERRGGGGGRGGEKNLSFVEGREEEEEEEEEEDYDDDDEDASEEEENYGGGHDRYGEKRRRRDGEYDDGECHDDDEDISEDDDVDGYESDGPGSSEEDEAHVVVVFPRLLPNLEIVRTVWREARGCLYEPDSKG